VAVEAAFENLAQELDALRELLREIAVTVQQDHPQLPDSSLVERLGDTLTDLQSWIEEAFAAAASAHKSAAEAPPDLLGARRSLSVSHENFHRASRMLYSDFLSYERIVQLVNFAKEHGREWLAWVQAVRQGLDRCPAQLQAVSEAHLRCWQELAERAEAHSVSAHVTKIGQKVSSGEKKPKRRR
jgi:hypothetical protein